MADWSAYPMNDAVRWPLDEKVLGLLGVAPLATADFYGKLIARPVERGWRHLKVLMDCDPKIPSRGRYFELGESDPTPFIQRGIRELAERGADLVAVACNTAHLLYERYSQGAPVYVPNLVEITAGAAARALGRGSGGRVLVLSTALSAERRLYAPYLENLGLRPVAAKHQDRISKCIEDVKRGRDRALTNRSFRELALSQPEAEIIITGCTELSLLAAPDLPGRIWIDSNQALADHCHDYCQGKL